MSKRVIFLGSKAIGLSCLKLMYNLDPGSLIGIVSIDDSSDSRSVFSEFVEFCKEKNLKLFIAKNKKHSEELIVDLNPTIGFVVGWYWLINKQILDKVPYGLIGIHNSLLPKYRGGAPLVWAMINGEMETGVSLFSFTAGMDDGPIWGQKKFLIDTNHYISDILEIAEKSALSLLEENYLAILNNNLNPNIQDHSKTSYCALRIPQDGLIDWSLDAKKIYNFIRAQSPPYPGAYTMLKEEKIVISKCELLSEIYYGTPGQIAWVNESGTIIICGYNTAVLAKEVIIEGKKLEANKIFNSIQIRLVSR